MRQPSFVSDVVKFNAAECIDKIEDYDAHPMLLNCARRGGRPQERRDGPT